MKILAKILIGIAILVVGYLYFENKRIERIDKYQQEIHEKSLPLLEMGQSLGAATGIFNREQYWAKQITLLQKAGGLKSPQIAQMILLQTNATYRKQGGIKNKAILDMLKEISPFFGNQQLAADEAAKLIEFAGDSSVPPDANEYWKFLAEMQANFKMSKARTFGEYITNFYVPASSSANHLLALGQEIEEATLLLDLGQGIEAATSTKGQQQYWAEQITLLQKAGGLKTPQIAQMMMLQANATYRKQGGITDKTILDMLKEIAPFFGEQQLSADEASKLIEFAGIAGVPATTEDFKVFFKKLQIGVKASKAKTFDEFLISSQKSLTDYILAGGTLEKGISLYAASRSGVAIEFDATIIMDDLMKLVIGLDFRQQKAIERAMNVSWPKLSTDQRVDILIRYVGGIIPAHKERILKRLEFPADTTAITESFLSSQAIVVMNETRQQLRDITADSKIF